MQAVVILKTKHKVFTKLMRDAIKYGEGTANATKKDVWNACRKIYKDYPELLKAIKPMFK